MTSLTNFNITEPYYTAKTFYDSLQTPDLGLLMNPQLPKTLLDAHPVAIYNMQYYSAEGISFTPIKPMKLWKIAYEGQMRLQKDPTKLVDVKFEVEFTSDFPHFVFDTGMDVHVLARAFAREKWNRQFFENLKRLLCADSCGVCFILFFRAHQTHYEQMGRLNGSLVINGDKREISMEGFRDHSFGNDVINIRHVSLFKPNFSTLTTLENKITIFCYLF